MERSPLKKPYLPPELDIFRLSALDVLKTSGNIPEGSKDEDIDENQGMWVG